jgi:hypothetical protein
MHELSRRLLYYKQKNVQEKIVDSSKDREVGIRYGEKGFGKRPDVLVYENDVFSAVKKNATSFHVSEERWSDPLDLRTDMRKHELDELRSGWDLVLDIDCPYWTYSKLTTHLLIKALKQHNIKTISCKFSGNKGFHIGVPFEAFPAKVNDVHIKNWFPDGPKRIALYLLKYITTNLIKIKKNGEIIFDNKYKSSLKKLSKLTGKSQEKFDLRDLVELDTLLISSRHMYRAPYSLHEKSGLVSLPINPDKVMEFKKEMAEPKKVTAEKEFLNPEKAEKNEALQLMINAFDYGKEDDIYKEIYKQDNEKKKTKEFDLPDQAIPEEYFPPSIKKGLEGLKDGKKRFLFILINFLRTSGWTYKNIEERVREWNKKNPKPLKETYLIGQLRYAKVNKDIVPPPNYSTQYYQDLGLSDPENIMRKYKNPVMYARVLYEQNKKKSRRLTKEQKEMRRKYRETLKNKKKAQLTKDNEDKKAGN